MNEPNAYSQQWFDLFLRNIDPKQTAREVDFLCRQLPIDRYSRVLDICCNTGGFGVYAKARGGAALAIRREMFRELGGFTSELFMYHEDVELSWRAHLHGLRVVVDPSADVFHEYDFSSNPTKIAVLERNRLIFVLSAYSSRLLLLLGPVLLLGEFALLAVAARDRWFRGKLGGWWWLMSHPHWLVRHRRETQRLRTVRDRELAHLLAPTLDPKMTSLPKGTGFLNRLLGSYWSLVRKGL